MMIYGQFNVFPRHQGMEILRKAHAALAPGGRLLLELQSATQIQKGGESGPNWYSAPSGLFSDKPHLVLQENFWDAEAAASTARLWQRLAGKQAGRGKRAEAVVVAANSGH